jgi:hypothetical protein
MTLVPEIHDQIRATAQRQAIAVALGHRQGGRWRRAGGRWRRAAGPLMVTASMLVVVSVVAVAIIAGGTHDLANPAPPAAGQGGSPPNGWAKFNAAAATQTQTHDAGCRPQLLSGPAAFRHDAPSRDLSSQLAALRHPAPASERVSAKLLRRAIRQLIPLDRFARGVYLRYVRRGQMNGITYYLIPAANVNQIRAVPNRCYHEQLAAFSQQAAKLAAVERGPLISYEISWLQAVRTAARHPAGVCLVHIGDGAIGRGRCATAITARQPLRGAGSGGSNNSTVTTLIVPDRVATVTAHYSPQTYPGRVPRALNVTQQAINNVVIFNFRGAWDPPSSLIYRSAKGSIIWSWTRK